LKDYFHAELKELTQLHRSQDWHQCLERCEKFKEVLSFLPTEREPFWSWTHFYIFTCHFYLKDYQKVWELEKLHSVFELTKKIKNHGYVASVLVEVALKVDAHHQMNSWVNKLLCARIDSGVESEVQIGIRTSYQLVLMTFKREIITQYILLLRKISEDYQRPLIAKMADAFERAQQADTRSGSGEAA